MTLKKSILEQELKGILKDSFEKAFKATFSANVSEGDDLKTIQAQISKDFGEEAAKSASKIASAIDKYIKTATIITPQGNGTIT